MRRLYDLCSALLSVAILAVESDAIISAQVPRVAAMASRAALRGGQLDAASAYYEFASDTLRVLDESVGADPAATPLRRCLNQLRDELDAAKASP